MKQAKRAAILSIGTELTRGELLDTNSNWISERLTTLGFEVAYRFTCSDRQEDIVDIFLRASERADVVVSTGGLGPTSDDLTSASIAAALEKPMVRDPDSILAIEARFRSLGRTASPSNAKQADFPEGAEILVNPNGTAPGFMMRRVSGSKETRAFFMPGVPREAKPMFEEQVLPRLSDWTENNQSQIKLRCFGLPEAEVGEKLAALEAEHPNLTLGYRATFPEIEVKILCRGESFFEAVEEAQIIETKVRALLGDAVYSQGDVKMPELVGAILRERGAKIALAESCTGGLLATLLTDGAGSSDYFDGSAVTYANSWKSNLLGVESSTLETHGAVSEASAIAMAEGALRLSNSDCALSITGIAGPGGGSEEKPVGTTFVALARTGQPTIARKYALYGNREWIRTRAAWAALNLLRKTLLAEPNAE